MGAQTHRTWEQHKLTGLGALAELLAEVRLAHTRAAVVARLARVIARHVVEHRVRLAVVLGLELAVHAEVHPKHTAAHNRQWT